MEYVSQNKVATIVEEYDWHVLLPLLVVVSKYLNLGRMEGPPPTPINEPRAHGRPSSFNTHQ
jgi:hypothetical protein